jgi:hypothetical protein
LFTPPKTFYHLFSDLSSLLWLMLTCAILDCAILDCAILDCDCVAGASGSELAEGECCWACENTVRFRPTTLRPTDEGAVSVVLRTNDMTYEGTEGETTTMNVDVQEAVLALLSMGSAHTHVHFHQDEQQNRHHLLHNTSSPTTSSSSSSSRITPAVTSSATHNSILTTTTSPHIPSSSSPRFDSVFPTAPTPTIPAKRKQRDVVGFFEEQGPGQRAFHPPTQYPFENGHLSAVFRPYELPRSALAPPAPSEAIDCMCEYTIDNGFSVACDRCSRWCHGVCFGLTNSDETRDINFWCWRCEPRSAAEIEFARRAMGERLAAIVAMGKRRKASPGMERKRRASAAVPGEKRKRRLSVVQLPTPVVPAPNGGTTDEEHVDIDGPWTQFYVHIAQDIVPSVEQLEVIGDTRSDLEQFTSTRGAAFQPIPLFPNFRSSVSEPFSNSSSSMIRTLLPPSPDARFTSHPRQYASSLNDPPRNPPMVPFPYPILPSSYEPDSEDHPHVRSPGSEQAFRFYQGISSMPAPPPPFISRSKSFIKKQQEQAYVNSNAFPNTNPIHFDIKRKMKSRRKAHHVHSTSESSTRFDTDGFSSSFPSDWASGAFTPGASWTFVPSCRETTETLDIYFANHRVLKLCTSIAQHTRANKPCVGG